MRRNYIILAAVMALVLVFPLLDKSDFHLDVVTKIGIFFIAALGLNLLMGYAGQISLGHAAFFGMGAYFSMVMTHKKTLIEDWLSSFGWMPDFVVAMAHSFHMFAQEHMVIAALVGAAFTGLVALVLGIPTLRLKGHYLAMATLGLGIIIGIVFKEEYALTGGPSGMRGIPKLWIFGPPAEGADYIFYYYYLVWVSAAILIGLSIHLVHSRVGRALRAIHADELAASASGVPVMKMKLTVFALSAVYASLAGSLYAHYQSFVSPSPFDFMASVKLVIMVVVGGMGSIWGALLGASLLYLLPQVLTAVEDYEMAIFGLVLMLTMILAPKGLAGLASGMWQRVADRGREEGADT